MTTVSWASTGTTRSGAGAATISSTAESGDNAMFGDDNLDTLNGGGGNDTLTGGADSDPDRLNGGSGNNVYFPTPPDIIVGSVTPVTASLDAAGILHVDGTDTTADRITIRLSGTTVDVTGNRAGLIQVPVFIARPDGSVVEQLDVGEVTGVDANGGNLNDVINLTTNFLPGATLIGGGGNDTLQGGLGGDTIDGGIGNDFVLGRGGRRHNTWRRQRHGSRRHRFRYDRRRHRE